MAVVLEPRSVELAKSLQLRDRFVAQFAVELHKVIILAIVIGHTELPCEVERGHRPPSESIDAVLVEQPVQLGSAATSNRVPANSTNVDHALSAVRFAASKPRLWRRPVKGVGPSSTGDQMVECSPHKAGHIIQQRFRLFTTSSARSAARPARARRGEADRPVATNTEPAKPDGKNH